MYNLKLKDKQVRKDDKEDELEKHDSLESTFVDDEDDEENQDVEAKENNDMEDAF
ncbi:hypothetical protein SLEP1_g25482 [Rubroshorea leprosula]|uniref:Uncharacterized protein n=1 Tax=Rubroshorea leprosula TaxID=152421 RepID=A0AAV5JTC9_9ROSI|nr:hypothetical protein SLEP1_g25482 [Rubroshorea leprosula]